MSEEDRVRLGGAWYDPSEQKGWVVDGARRKFLLTVGRRSKARQVLVNLRDDVLPVHERASPSSRVRANQLKRYPELESAIHQWGRHFHLCDGQRGTWTIEYALNTLHLWQLMGEENMSPRVLQFVPPVKVYWEKSELPEFSFPAWLIQIERRSDYKGELCGALNKYLDDAEKVAREAGFVPDAHSFSKRDFEWLVRRQIEEESFDHIALNPKVKLGAVKQAVTRLRKLIDLPTLPAGRPRSPVPPT